MTKNKMRLRLSASPGDMSLYLTIESAAFTLTRSSNSANLLVNKKVDKIFRANDRRINATATNCPSGRGGV